MSKNDQNDSNTEMTEVNILEKFDAKDFVVSSDNDNSSPTKKEYSLRKKQ